MIKYVMVCAWILGLTSVLSAQEPCTDSISAVIMGDTVIVYHTGAYYNCCSKIEYTIVLHADTIDLIESETGDPCDCLCCFDLSTTITNLVPGTYLVRVWNEDQSILYGQVEVTIGGNVSPGEVTQSECLDGTIVPPGRAWEPCEDSVFAEVLDNTVIVYHTGAFYNCCAIIEYTLEQEDIVINLVEKETFPEGPCYCLCCFDLSVSIEGLSPGVYLIRVWNEDKTELYGEVEVIISGERATLGEVIQSGCTGKFIRGDADGNTLVEMGDAMYILRYKFVPGTPPPACMDAADANDDGRVESSDAIYILRYKFIPGSPPLFPPFPDCGSDPTLDRLGCEEHPCGW